MSAEWKEFRLGDITEWASGGTPSKKNADFWNGTIPWISASSMGSNRYDESDLKITQEGLKAGSRIAKKNSILLLVRGSTLHQRIPVGITTSDVSFNQDVKAIIAKEDFIEPWYLLFWFMAKEKDLLNMVENTGIGAGKLDTKLLQNMLIKIPSDVERNRICRFVKALDDKLLLNHQINQTLESMAQVIFKSWFVDFEPVKAKIAAIEAGEDAEGVTRAAMRAISGKTDDELDQMQVEQPENYAQLKTTAELFPAAMQDSELGKVPEGWEVKLSGEIMDVRDGTHDSPKKSEKGFPLLTSKHITSGILMMDTAYLISQQDYENVNKRSKVNQGDILLTMIGTVGIPYLVMQRDVNFAIKNVGLFRTSENICLKNYYYLLLKSEGMQKYLEARMAGTTQKYLSLKTLRSIELLVPSGNIMDCFNVITNSLLDYSYALQVEAGYLAKLRDILLPKLLSGELSVDAIKITNEQAGE